jgi:hypothetical protein
VEVEVERTGGSETLTVELGERPTAEQISAANPNC